MHSLSGMSLGAYQIVEQIGQGGMATVYKAYQPSVDRYVAVKVLPAHLSEDPTFVARFEREARILARLEHPHILPIHDYGEVDGLTYLVMRYVDAGTLKDLIAREGPPPLREVARIVDQVGRALDYAHRQGVLHRDIKPSNVLIDRGRDTFLTDFGIARLVADTAQYTASGAIIGTPAYMAPEQGLGERVDERCDIYALGVLLYEMVTGRVPYEAETPLAVVLKHIHDPLPMPRQLRPDLPEAVERVILKAMAKAPADRWQTARAMVDALNQAVAQLPAEAPAARPAPAGLASTVVKGAAAPGAAPATLDRPPAPPARPARRLPRWAPLAAGALLLVALVAVAVLFLGGGDKGGAAGGTPTAAATLAAAETPPGGGTPAGETDVAVQPSAAPPSPAAPAPAAGAPGWTNYTNANLAIALAPDGDRLWVGGEGGLVRWSLGDGRYVKLGVADGLASVRINDLLVDGRGVVWAATAAGLCRFDGSAWTTFDRADGLDSNWVEALWQDASGALWAGTAYGERGLNYFAGAGWGAPPIPPLPVDAPAITALAGDGGAGLYVGTADAGLAHYDGQEWTLLGSADGLPGNRVVALALSGGDLWASFDDALVRFDRATGDWERVRDVMVYAMHTARDGAVWFGTSDGAIRLDPAAGDWQPFEAAAGLVPAGRGLIDIAEQGDTLWFASYGEGAVSFDGREWKSWLTDDRLGGNLVDAMRLGQDGALWVTHPGTGLSRYDPAGGTWQSFGEADGAFDWPSAPGVDGQGRVWIARDGSLAAYDGRGWQSYAAPALEGVGVQAIAIGPGDVQWLRTDAGLLRHDPAGDTWTPYGSADHPVLADVQALLIARDGRVWAGGEAGLVSYDGSRWSADAAAGEALRDVKDIAEAADGSLWLAADGSLVHLEGGKRYLFRRPDEGYLAVVAVAPDGSVWAGYEGVGRFDPASSRWQLFGTADGLIDMRVTELLVAPDGSVWIGTEGGVSRYLPPTP